MYSAVAIALIFSLAAVPPPRITYRPWGPNEVFFVEWLLHSKTQDPEKPWVAVYDGHAKDFPKELRQYGFRVVALSLLLREKPFIIASPFHVPLASKSVSLFMFLAHALDDVYQSLVLLMELVAPIKAEGYFMFSPEKAKHFPMLLQKLGFYRMPFSYKGLDVWRRMILIRSSA